ncbi:MAG: TonB-dependent receptor [bacterium]|nr:TonB-dependent receptor [bacterium]
MRRRFIFGNVRVPVVKETITLARTFLLMTVLLLVGMHGGAQEPEPSEDSCHPVAGTVVDRSSGRPLVGVLVTTGSALGVVTDADGRFDFCTRIPGPVTLVVRLDGGMESKHEVRVRSDHVTIAVDSAAKPEFSDEMIVTGRSVDSVGPEVQISPQAVVAMPGAGEDVLQTLGALPGVVSADDWSSRLYVRGGRPDQNGIYIDGISVFDPYRLFGLTSLFNPETLRSIAFYPGGFDVRYGDRLSAVIAVENRDGRTDRKFAGSANVAMVHTNLVGEGRLSESMPSSWMVSARRTYYDVALKLSEDTESSYPAFADAQARLMFEPAEGHRFSMTVLGYDESTDLAEDEESDFGDVDDRIEALDDQKGFIAGLRGEHWLSRRARLDWVLSATRNQQSSDFFFREGETSFETGYVQKLTGDVLSLRSTLEYAAGRHTLLAGIEAAQSKNEVSFRFRTDDPRIHIPDWLQDFAETQDFRRRAAFIQDTVQIVPTLAFKAGVRWDQSTLTDSSSTSPRASLRWEPSDHWQLRAAWGHYTQFASYESLQGDGYFLDLRGIKELQLEPERAEHWLVGALHSNDGGWTLGIDLYHKELDDILQSGEYMEEILVLDDDDFAVPYMRTQDNFVPENSRNGFARGVELTFTLLEGSGRPYWGMVGYAFGQTKTRDQDGLWWWEDWDRRHTVTLIGGWRLSPRWEIGARWRYATGFPTTPLTNVIRVVEDVDGDGIYDPEAGDYITYQRDEPDEVINSERLPDYHRLDLRVQYKRSYTRVDTIYYLDIINAYARENVFGWDYNQDLTDRTAETGMPIVPSFGVKISF